MILRLSAIHTSCPCEKSNLRAQHACKLSTWLYIPLASLIAASQIAVLHGQYTLAASKGLLFAKLTRTSDIHNSVHKEFRCATRRPQPLVKTRLAAAPAAAMHAVGNPSATSHELAELETGGTQVAVVQLRVLRAHELRRADGRAQDVVGDGKGGDAGPRDDAQLRAELGQQLLYRLGLARRDDLVVAEEKVALDDL